MFIRIPLRFILMFGCRQINRKRKIDSHKQACIGHLSFLFTLLVAYSNSSLQSCCVVFFVGFGGRDQEVLSDFYLLRRFLEDCIVILLSLILTIINKKLFRKQLFWYSHTSLRRHICSKFIRNNTYIWLQ